MCNLLSQNIISPQMPTPENDQTHSINLSAITKELFECVWLYCRADAERLEVFACRPSGKVKLHAKVF